MLLYMAEKNSIPLIIKRSPHQKGVNVKYIELLDHVSH